MFFNCSGNCGIWIFCRFRLSVRVILWSQVFLFFSTEAEWKWPAVKRLWSHTHTHTFCPVFFSFLVSCPAEHVVHFSSIQLQIWIHRETLNEKGNFPTAYIFLSLVAEMRWFGKSCLYPLVNRSLVCQLISFTTTAAGCSAFWSRDVKMYPAAGWF